MNDKIFTHEKQRWSHTVEEQNYGANHSRARKYNPIRNNSNDWLSNAQSQCDSMISERYNDLQLCANSRSNSCGSPGKNKKAGVKLKFRWSKGLRKSKNCCLKINSQNM